MWVHTCNVTAYRNTVSWRCGRDSWPRNVSKVGYAVTLRACSVRCRYLAVASKGWYGYGLSMSARPTWHVTTVFTFMMLLAPVTNWKPHGVKLAGCCYAMRHRMKVQIVTPFRVRHLQSYGVTVRGNVTTVYATVLVGDRHSSVGIATRYGLDGRGSNPGGCEIFGTRPDRPWRPPSLLYNGYGVFPGGKAAGRGFDHPTHLAPRLKKE
jgi:hypothetical protein